MVRKSYRRFLPKEPRRNSSAGTASSPPAWTVIVQLYVVARPYCFLSASKRRVVDHNQQTQKLNFYSTQNHSRKKSPVKNHSQKKSPVKNHSRRKSPVKNHSRKKSPVKNHSRKKSPVKNHSRKKSPVKTDTKSAHLNTAISFLLIKLFFFAVDMKNILQKAGRFKFYLQFRNDMIRSCLTSDSRSADKDDSCNRGEE